MAVYKGMAFNKYEIVYRDEENEIVVGEFSGNMSYTVDQALDIAGVDMDKFAEENGWDGWDWNCLDFRVKK